MCVLWTQLSSHGDTRPILPPLPGSWGPTDGSGRPEGQYGLHRDLEAAATTTLRAPLSWEARKDMGIDH